MAQVGRCGFSSLCDRPVLERCIETYRRLGCLTPRIEIAPEAFAATLGIYAYNGPIGERFTGAVYKTSGWIQVGTTQGRGRYDRHTKRAQSKQDIRLR